MRKSMETMTNSFYPQFETFQPLKVFLCQFCVSKMPLKSYKICSKIFEHGLIPPLPPTPLNNVKKTADLGDDATPNTGHISNLAAMLLLIFIGFD